jgi:hypothetical protein
MAYLQSIRDKVREKLTRGEAPSFDVRTIERNEKYRVFIHSSASPKSDVIAYLPEEFQFAVESTWDADIFEFGPVSKVAQYFKDKAFQSYFLFWKGSSPITMTLPLEFRARTDAYKEVVEPCLILQKLALPYGLTHKFVITPPGPTPSGKGDHITVKLGKFLYFEHVVFTNVEVQYKSMMSPEGYPMKASANVQLQTSKIVSRELLDEYYNTDLR